MSGRLLGLQEAAEKLGLSHARLRQLAQAGTLPAQKVGGSWVIAETQLQRFADRERPPGRPRRRRRRRSAPQA